MNANCTTHQWFLQTICHVIGTLSHMLHDTCSITWMPHDSHMIITWQPHVGYMTLPYMSLTLSVMRTTGHLSVSVVKSESPIADCKDDPMTLSWTHPPCSWPQSFSRSPSWNTSEHWSRETTKWAGSPVSSARCFMSPLLHDAAVSCEGSPIRRDLAGPRQVFSSWQRRDWAGEGAEREGSEVHTFFICKGQ